MIDWLEKRIILDDTPWVFRTAIRSKVNVDLTAEIQELWSLCDTVVIEICSRKKYEYIDSSNALLYLHHLIVDPRFVKYNDTTVQHRVVLQTDEEIEQDLLTIRDRIGLNRNLLIVTHYDALLHGQLIHSRHTLIECVERLCTKHDWLCVNPTKVLIEYPQHEVMSEDLGHYTLKGEQIISTYIDEIIANFCKNR